MEKQDPLAVVIRLQQASPNQIAVGIEEAAISVGYLWRCATCSWTNDGDIASCEECGEARPESMEAPVETSHIPWHCGVTLCGKPLAEVKTILREEIKTKKANCVVCNVRAEIYQLFPT